MKTILAIDPGNTHSGWTLINATTCKPIKIGKTENKDLRSWILNGTLNPDHVAIEMIASYGMAVGATVFETCVWIGRFEECFPKTIDVKLTYRQPIKLHHCKTGAAKDANVTQALLDRFTPGQPNYGKGTKQNPGWFHGFKSDIWQAYALAVYTADQLELNSANGTPRDVLSCPGTQGVLVPSLDEVPEFVVGSLVRVGKGKKLWRVAEIWSDRPVATLKPLDGYSSTTVDIGRLVAVSEREAA